MLDIPLFENEVVAGINYPKTSIIIVALKRDQTG